MNIRLILTEFQTRAEQYLEAMLKATILSRAMERLNHANI